MIARDEARCIERCLDSVRAHVDAMLVLDTGSRDATPEIARRAGAQVAHFNWCDDFAAARNAALQAADADWALVLDADEWLVEGAAALHALRECAPSFAGVIRVDNLFGVDAARATRSMSWLSRVLPRGARYSGRVHEQPDATWPRRRLDITVCHDGYLDAPMHGKRGRNEHLLHLALAERRCLLVESRLYEFGLLMSERGMGNEAEALRPKGHASACNRSAPAETFLASLLRVLGPGSS